MTDSLRGFCVNGLHFRRGVFASLLVSSIIVLMEGMLPLDVTMLRVSRGRGGTSMALR